MKKLLTFPIVLLLLLTSATYAQLVHFSQYYSSPAIMGPSFAGLGEKTKAVLNYRNQWPGVPGNYVTYAFAFDHYLPKRYSGIGLTVLRDQAGSGNLNLTSAGVQYTYDIILLQKKLHARPGIGFQYSQRGVDFYRLIFADQLSFDGINPTTTENPPTTKGYFDATASLMLYSKRFWIGVNGDHLLRPNQSMYGGIQRLPIVIQSYGGINLRLKDKRKRYRDEMLTITYNFMMSTENKFKQLDIGAYWTKDPFRLGVWYRGLPVLNDYENGYANTDAVILMLGYKLSSFSIGYSYDITVSNLVGSTSGSHELSLRYDFNFYGPRKPKTRKGAIPCPIFY